MTTNFIFPDEWTTWMVILASVLHQRSAWRFALIVKASWPNPDGPEKPIEDYCPAVVRLFCIFFCIRSQLLALIYERIQSIVVL